MPNCVGEACGCEICGKQETFPYQCKYCYKIVCGRHRLPENHNCPYAPPKPNYGKVRYKRADNRKDNTRWWENNQEPNGVECIDDGHGNCEPPKKKEKRFGLF